MMCVPVQRVSAGARTRASPKGMAARVKPADFGAITGLINQISRIPAGPLRRQQDRQWWREVTGPLPNVWLGVSVENQKWADIRIPALLDTCLLYTSDAADEEAS